ncbi:MAG: GTPase Era [Saprospiraceae bacterium]|nr:GTPase Era [Saprospiraceae bacterium]
MHRSGFVNILGRPNMGKSTLLNALVGEKMSIITSKPQTTRHRIIGIVSSDDFQIVFSDTPGFIDEPAYRMHQMMNAFISLSFDDADIILFVTDPYEPLSEQHNLLQRIASHTAPVLAIINKKDMVSPEELAARVEELAVLLPTTKIHTVSALKGTGVPELMADIISLLPEGPEFYPKDQLTDRPERFFVSEIIRGKILELYRDEIPYTCEITIESFTEGDSNAGPITRISATVYTLDERKKSILLGKGGSAIKELGTVARGEIEAFLGTRVFLELNIKVRDNWRDDEKALKSFGYQN